MKITIGGDRLGAGGKMQAELRSYERSTHNLGTVKRTTMAAGTLVPFYVEPTLPQDTHDIELNVDVLTHPTEGPLFGSYKIQLDVFECPARLYQSALHNNKLNIGRYMEQVLLPQVEIKANKKTPVTSTSQINPASIFAYLGIRGVGTAQTPDTEGQFISRKFNAIPWLGYWDIFKNYYANKQENVAYVIHTELQDVHKTIDSVNVDNNGTDEPIVQAPDYQAIELQDRMNIYYTGTPPTAEEIILQGSDIMGAVVPNRVQTLANTFMDINDTGTGTIICTGLKNRMVMVGAWDYSSGVLPNPTKPISLTPFVLENIDTMRETILQKQWNEQFLIAEGTFNADPFQLALETTEDGQTSITHTQEGLAVKTYQSDLFNNWMNTEWIDGPDGINAISAVSTAGGSFTIDALQTAKKVYDMLNRVAISDGSYKSWIEVNYDNEGYWMTETPIYCGSLIKELVFQEVVSNSSSQINGQEQPLGQLAGKGTMAQKHKGGKITIRTKEHGFIIGIMSLTPRVDYSQGNKWWTNLNNMNDWHKPALDQIGFQDLITEQMHYGDAIIADNGTITLHSAGKQPAWVNYMTNINETYGNFAIEDNEMFMTLNRRYEYDDEATGTDSRIKDLTTYIDPSKYNFIFAETALDSQNFWVQVSVENEARRKMSAKVMPNL